MGQIIDGKKLADEIKDKIAKQIFDLKGPRPNLAIILVGTRADSELYVKLKEEEAKKVGIDTHLYRCPDNIPEQEILDMIAHFNQDEMIDGILIQLPLPKGLDTDKIIKSLDPEKDVDCFHPDNLKDAFVSCKTIEFMSPVFKTVSRMLCSVDCNLENKNICVLCNSDVFGESLAKTLGCSGAKVEVVYADKFDEEKTKKADILITAIGKPNFIKKEMIKEGVIIIDIGTTKVGKKVVGDVDFEDVENKVSYITPVPGGVGPMTIAYLFENCLLAYRKKHK